MLYLIDAERARTVRSAASVSGGSLTNAFFGLYVDLATVKPAAMWQHAKAFAYQIARRGTLWAAPLTYLYSLTIAMLPAAAIVVSCFCPWWAIALTWVIVLTLGGWLSQQRSAVVAAAFESTLLGKAKLSAMNGTVSHIICATDLQMGQNVFFSSGFVYSWRTGWGAPATLRVAQAAQASAALPGAFSVVSLRLKRFALPEERAVAQGRNPPRRFKLLDGGVYDNMGTEWLLNIGKRIGDGTPPMSLKTVDEAIVVNASAGDQVTARRWVKIPFVGEIASLLAVKDVMYRQTTAVRRRLLNVRYHLAQDQDSVQPTTRILRDALRGTTIQIDRTPFELPDKFSQSGDELSKRAKESIAALEKDFGTGDARAYWAAQAEANHNVKTTLSRIGAERAQSLVRHGYVLTMINSHVLLGYPLLSLPTNDECALLIAKSR